jgi:N-dimethylarginine dimethylaminohydrolase
MKTTCHSEYGLLQQVFVKHAKAAFISAAQIEQDWERLQFLGAPALEKAEAEYSVFENLLSKTGAQMHQLPMDERLSIDSIYCRDASIATDFGIIICNMGKPARSLEPSAQLAAFKAKGLNILGEIVTPGTVEGGDTTWLDTSTLAVALSYRTNEAGIKQLIALLQPRGIKVITVPLPHYKGPSDVFHLMSVISIVDHNLAVVYSPLMPIVFRNELLRRGFELIEVGADEFDQMGCNVLAIGPRICLMVRGCNQTRKALENAGCLVYEYQGKEISIKGGGGPTCLTRPLERIV